MTKTNENAGKTPSKVGGENFKRLSHAVNVFWLALIRQGTEGFTACAANYNLQVLLKV